jgi:hypothetical protein
LYRFSHFLANVDPQAEFVQVLALSFAWANSFNAWAAGERSERVRFGERKAEMLEWLVVTGPQVVPVC